ncbi:RagB/SusD family nutrient uptake outer membrane protein [Bacteroides pyogenes]|uniref:RagB/SusD family nutrient uptake outer membrane protein n=1 Tax=Bacteroides pyogenes TaxID=310300 RepID=UPI002A91996C|nr:RagB/SusD family nutrient uptake outer membrane protein [Bacteroides pyogenes]MDY5434360.1 RagB/SusD family nutrient uptake outer membrane protein [Bacteroides pyogenes]
MKKKNILCGIVLICGLTACYDLDKAPKGVLSTASPFSSTGEMTNYLDQFYESGLRSQGFDAGGGNHIAGSDTRSDNLASSSVNTRLAGEMALSHATALSNYKAIRNLNYLLLNLDNTSEKGTAAYNQCVGEAYYFRAWYYYRMFVDYGELTWIDKPLDPNIEAMLLPRDSRTVVADHILDDLDKAISLLRERNNSASMRVHKDVARALKSEVALFEATWEKYHKAEGDEFYDKSVTDEKIRDYFTQAAAAAEEVMKRGVWKVYNTGNTGNDYRQLFQTTDLSNNSEVLWFKKYDGDKVGNNVNRYLNQGGGSIGVTASLVDDYLTIDGKPFVGEQRVEAKKVFGNELLPTVRDPRLAQTVCTPGQQLRPDDAAPFYVVPPLIGSSSYNQNMTGYSLLKHVQIDYTGSLDAEFKGATPAIQFRYADVLLNYAEALAELDGAANAQKIADALKPLRDRVGMPGVDFDREYNQEADYPFRKLNKYVQAVRRERRVEQACEGHRLEDILRWAAADELIVGQWPKGALFIGSNLENHPKYGGKLVYDKPSGNNLYLTGKQGDALRYILPSNPAGYEQGWKFNVKRDYLLPIRIELLERTQNQWKQNPGW